MKKQKFVVGVATACDVVFSILKVFAAIGAVAILVSSLFLLVLPGDFFSIETDTDVKINFSMESLLGDAWDEALKENAAALPEGVELTEDGFAMKEGVLETLTGRSMSLLLIPLFTQMITLFFFYRFLQKAAREVRLSVFSPFTLEGAANLKNAGLVLFAVEAAPALTQTLVTLFTRGHNVTAMASFEIDMMGILWGFVLIALSYLFEFGASLTPKPTPSFQNQAQ